MVCVQATSWMQRAPVPSWMLSSCWRLLRTRGSFSSPCRVAWRWPTIPPSMRPALITITPGSKILRIPTRRQCCRFGSDLICFLSGSDNTVVLQKIIIARKYMKVINIGTARRSFTLREQCDENFETHIFAGKKLKNFCVVDETLTCNFRTGTSIQIKCLLLYLSFFKVRYNLSSVSSLSVTTPTSCLCSQRLRQPTFS